MSINKIFCWFKFLDLKSMVFFVGCIVRTCIAEQRHIYDFVKSVIIYKQTIIQFRKHFKGFKMNHKKNIFLFICVNYGYGMELSFIKAQNHIKMKMVNSCSMFTELNVYNI